MFLAIITENNSQSSFKYLSNFLYSSEQCYCCKKETVLIEIQELTIYILVDKVMNMYW